MRMPVRTWAWFDQSDRWNLLSKHDYFGMQFADLARDGPARPYEYEEGLSIYDDRISRASSQVSLFRIQLGIFR